LIKYSIFLNGFALCFTDIYSFSLQYLKQPQHLTINYARYNDCIIDTIHNENVEEIILIGTNNINLNEMPKIKCHKLKSSELTNITPVYKKLEDVNIELVNIYANSKKVKF
jgi:hypothetical protein